MVMPARNGAWKRLASVAVTVFQRSVSRNAAKWRGSSNPRAGRWFQRSSSRMRGQARSPTELRAPHPGRRRRRRRGGRWATRRRARSPPRQASGATAPGRACPGRERAREGFSDGQSRRVGARTRCRASSGASDKAAFRLPHPRHVAAARPDPLFAPCLPVTGNRHRVTARLTSGCRRGSRFGPVRGIGCRTGSCGR